MGFDSVSGSCVRVYLCAEKFFFFVFERGGYSERVASPTSKKVSSPVFSSLDLRAARWRSG